MELTLRSRPQGAAMRCNTSFPGSAPHIMGNRPVTIPATVMRSLRKAENKVRLQERGEARPSWLSVASRRSTRWSAHL